MKQSTPNPPTASRGVFKVTRRDILQMVDCAVDCDLTPQERQDYVDAWLREHRRAARKKAARKAARP